MIQNIASLRCFVAEAGMRAIHNKHQGLLFRKNFSETKHGSHFLSADESLKAPKPIDRPCIPVTAHSGDINNGGGSRGGGGRDGQGPEGDDDDFKYWKYILLLSSIPFAYIIIDYIIKVTKAKRESMTLYEPTFASMTFSPEPIKYIHPQKEEMSQNSRISFALAILLLLGSCSVYYFSKKRRQTRRREGEPEESTAAQIQRAMDELKAEEQREKVKTAGLPKAEEDKEEGEESPEKPFQSEIQEETSDFEEFESQVNRPFDGADKLPKEDSRYTDFQHLKKNEDHQINKQDSAKENISKVAVVVENSEELLKQQSKSLTNGNGIIPLTEKPGVTKIMEKDENKPENSVFGESELNKTNIDKSEESEILYKIQDSKESSENPQVPTEGHSLDKSEEEEVLMIKQEENPLPSAQEYFEDMDYKDNLLNRDEQNLVPAVTKEENEVSEENAKFVEEIFEDIIIKENKKAAAEKEERERLEEMKSSVIDAEAHITSEESNNI